MRVLMEDVMYWWGGVVVELIVVMRYHWGFDPVCVRASLASKVTEAVSQFERFRTWFVGVVFDEATSKELKSPLAWVSFSCEMK